MKINKQQKKYPPYPLDVPHNKSILVREEIAPAHSTQVGGDHYTKMLIDPLTLTYDIVGTPCFCKVAKYLTRDKDDKLLNLQKALHCLQWEDQVWIPYLHYRAVKNIKQEGEKDHANGTVPIAPSRVRKYIKDFANQFPENKERLYNILYCMYHRQHEESIDLVKGWIREVEDNKENG